MTNHQYAENVWLNISSDAHVHYTTNLPSDVVDTSLLIYRDDPFVFDRHTYFPTSFQSGDLRQAFTNINSTTGWTVEFRSGRKSFVGEMYNGRYNIRIALQCDRKRAELITAYPVSIKDRKTHPDFFEIGGDHL